MRVHSCCVRSELLARDTVLGLYRTRHTGPFVTMTAVAALLCLAGPALAGPVGGTVVDGAAAISQAGATTNIHQSTNKAIINWQGFSVGANESVNFYQPGASSVTLNRVIGNEASVINGAINANGQVFIVNSAGVLFGKGSQVNVGGLVASTHDISNSDFMAGNYTFSGTSNASVINQGRIRTHGGGYVALLGKTVSNEGVIAARLGTVAMSAGEKLTLNFEGNSLLDVTIDKGALNALVENKRAIIADGGRVILTAKAADQVLSAQVNNTGIVQARTIAALKGGSSATGRKGRKAHPKANPAPEADPAGAPMAQENIKGNIKIFAYGGTANIAGTLDASAPKGGDGGFIETSGDKVTIADSAQILTKSASGTNGAWLIDPVDFTIAASGGDMTGAFLSNYLNTQGSSTILSSQGSTGVNGDINVNDAITWSSDNTLTLTAERNVNINQAITAKGASAGLVFNAGNDININNAVTLEGASTTLAMTYGGDYNIRTKASYAGAVLDADGKPIAQQDTSGGVYGSITFSSCVDTASCGTRLKINNVDYTLIGSMDQLAAIAPPVRDSDGNPVYNPDWSEVESTAAGNFALARNLDASGVVYSEAVVDVLDGTFSGLGHEISNLSINKPSYADRIGLFGKTLVGSQIRDFGLVNASIISTTSNYVGAIVGKNLANLHQVYSTGTVEGGNAGGLVGGINTYPNIAAGFKITNSFSDAEILGSSSAGGLVGQAGADASYGGLYISNSHSTGTMNGGGNLGGLVGNATSVSIVDSYATSMIGNASETPGTSQVNRGGLVGGLVIFDPPHEIRNSFATGDVYGATRLGGLVGYLNVRRFGVANSTFDISNSYATGDVTSTMPLNVSTDPGIGGLIGKVNVENRATFILKHAYATGDVLFAGAYGTYAGGLIGSVAGAGTTLIDTVYATGDVIATTTNPANNTGMGGLIGSLSSRTSEVRNSYSTGNVTGQTTVGGLVGYSQGKIIDSWASGAVNGGENVGGLVGNNDGLISGSHASGAVNGSTNVGGLVGNNGVAGSDAAIIENSWASGQVTAPPGTIGVGGIVGQMLNGQVNNSYYNAGANPGLDSVGNSVQGPNNNPTVNGGGALADDQIADAQYYANGTINQVLAARAEAAFRADAVRTGSTVATGADVASSSSAPATASSIRAMQKSATLDEVDDDLKQTEQKVKDDDERRAKRRKAAIAAATRAANAPRAPFYRGTIRSIEVDGQRFELERDGTPRSGNTNDTPASSGGAQ